MPPELQLFTIQDVARLFRVKTRTIQRWVAQGLFPPGMRITRQSRRWTTTAIQEFLARRNPTTPPPGRS